MQPIVGQLGKYTLSPNPDLEDSLIVTQDAAIPSFLGSFATSALKDLLDDEIETFSTFTGLAFSISGNSLIVKNTNDDGEDFFSIQDIAL